MFTGSIDPLSSIITQKSPQKTFHFENRAKLGLKLKFRNFWYILRFLNITQVLEGILTEDIGIICSLGTTLVNALYFSLIT